MLLLVAILAAIPAPGCSSSEDPAEDTNTKAPNPYGNLPALQETANPKLHEELERIIDEGGTPAQLAGDTPDETESLAAGLTALFPKKIIRPLLSKTSELFPASGFDFTTAQLQQIDEFLRNYGTHLDQARAVLSRPKAEFGIDYREGFSAELAFVDVAQVVARLEAFRAAVALEADNLSEAAVSLGYMFRVASCLAAEPHPITRLTGAFVRAEAFQVLQAIALHPRTGAEELLQLQELVAGQLAAWPDDANTWIADRGIGLHTYEVVRDGQVMSLLTDEEVDELEKSNLLDALRTMTPAEIDDDQLYYLEKMRNVIRSCTQPYYQRKQTLQAMATELEVLRGTSGFPLIAGLLLLPDIPNGHLIQARDRSRCEAWAFALARALGQPDPPTDTNPVTGNPYVTRRNLGRVLVYDEASDAETTEPMAAARVIQEDAVAP